MASVIEGNCHWEYNPEFDRWDTDCDEIVTRQGNGERPKDYGFRICPYCGREIEFDD